MNWMYALLAALVGYLLGSISFARLIARIFQPGQPIGETTVHVPDSQAAFKYDAISATTIRLNLGPRYGCLTSFLDMLKAAIPVLAFRLWQPDSYYYLIVAAMVTAGHNWPLYHRFKGGRGMSPILGGMAVVDWLGVLATSATGLLLGAVAGDFTFTDKLGVLLMIPWLWFRHHDVALTLYAVGVNGMLWLAMVPEAQELARLRREGLLEAYVRAKHVRIEGPQEGPQMDRLTAAGLLSRFVAWWRRDHEESVNGV